MQCLGWPFVRVRSIRTSATPKFDFAVIKPISSFVTDPDRGHLPMLHRKGSARSCCDSRSRATRTPHTRDRNFRIPAYPKLENRGELLLGALIPEVGERLLREIVSAVERLAEFPEVQPLSRKSSCAKKCGGLLRIAAIPTAWQHSANFCAVHYRQNVR